MCAGRFPRGVPGGGRYAPPEKGVGGVNQKEMCLYLATRTQMRRNRSRQFNLFMFPKGYVFKGSTDKGLPCAIAI
jgi:hypothetical protein